MQTVTLLKNDFKKEESRNIDREIALEKRIKQLDNIVFKRDQSAQMINLKARQLEPKLYDGNVIKNTSAIVIPDSEETLMLAEESRSKILLKQKDPMMNSLNSPDLTLYCRTHTKLWFQKELPKVIMVYTSLKKLKHHLVGFDVVIKERTTATAITKGSWGFEHTKACFRDEIIPFVKALKDLFNTFDQYLIDELSEVQNVFHQMEQAVEQHHSGCSKHMTGDHSQLTNFINKFLGTVKFGNDHVAKILGYGDYQIGNVMISRVYYVEGLGHNLFSVEQFYDSNLKVAFRQHTCFIRNLEGVDLLT
ncbi:hypothetical protein Tco_0646320 [Tanacetum coccineum]